MGQRRKVDTVKSVPRPSLSSLIFHSSFEVKVLSAMCLGLLLRILYLVQISHSPFSNALFMDSAIYDAWSDRILAGDLSGGRPFFIEPGYAILLAGIKLAGGGMTAIRALQVVFGMATIYLTARIAQRLGGAVAGLVAAFISAAYLPLVYFEGLILKTTLEVFVSTLLIWLILSAPVRAATSRLIILSLVLAASLLVRSTLLPVLLLGMLCYGLSLRRDGQSRPWSRAALIVSGPVALLLCLSIRNEIIAGEWGPLPYNSGINFYIGNCADCNGVDAGYPFGSGLPEQEEQDSRIEAERRAGHPLGYMGSSSFWWKEATHEILQSPGRWAHLLAIKALLFWNHYEITDNLSIYFVRMWSPVLRWPLPGFWLAAPLGFAGVAMGYLRRRDPGWLLVAGSLLLNMIIVVGFHVAERYRLSSVPLMIALGTASVTGIASVSPFKRLGVVLAGCMGGILVALPNPISPLGQNLTNHYTMLADSALSAGHTDEALQELHRAVLHDPEKADHHFNLAIGLVNLQHDDAQAEVSLRRALQLNPSLGDAWFLLGQVLDRLGRDAEATDAFLSSAKLGYRGAESLVSAGALKARLGRFDEALQLITEGLAIRPDYPHGLEMLGNTKMALGDKEGARNAWEKALSLDPTNARLKRLLEKYR